MAPRTLVVIVGIALVAVFAVEAAAKPVAERLILVGVADSDHDLSVGELTVERIGRPVVVGLLTGRLRDVQVSVRDARIGRLVVDRVDLELEEVRGIWSSPRVEVEPTFMGVVDEQALTRWLRARSPDLARPTVELGEGVVQLSDERVPFALSLALVLDGDVVRVVPSVGDPLLWTSLNLATEFPLPAAVTVTELAVERGTIRFEGTVAWGQVLP